MTNQDFLQLYQHLQFGICCNKLVDLVFASVAWSQISHDSFSNYAHLNRVVSRKELETIEQELISMERKPAVYFEDSLDYQSQVSILKQNKYKLEWIDSWMFFQSSKIDDKDFRQVRKVTSQKDLEQFLETFDKCYQKDDSQNPYGELGKYIDITRESWHRHHQSGKVEYFTVYRNQEPVAVSALTNFQGIGYISGVGSLLKVRGQGFGKIASLYAVNQSQRNGNQEHVLATEEGDYPNEFYKRIGFKTRFKATGYVKS